MSPSDDLQRRSSGEDSVEQEGVAESGNPGASKVGGSADQRLSGADAGELPAREAAVGAIPETRGGRDEAWKRGAGIQPQTAGEATTPDPAQGRSQVQRFRAELGGRAPGQRRPTGGAS